MKRKTTTTLTRPPIVTVLGHVDHGKTTLLDAIRKSNVAKGEPGGITQHIGAYQVEVATREGKRKITFIDTPGHEAFSEMRSRGAQATDLVILVVSAVEGVQPQTEESLKHIKKAAVPFIVAATKMDLADANIDRVKKHLSKIGILTEGYGGDVVVVPVSALSNQGIADLLEMILLVAEMKGLKGSAKDPFSGVIIESKLDNKRGAVATLLIKQGTIKTGDDIYLQREKIRIRAMFDEYDKSVFEALPSKPVEVLGFQSVPPVGAIVTKEKTETIAPAIDKTNNVTPSESQLPIILKVDTRRSLEAILGKIDPVAILVVDYGLGDITESDIMRAQGAKAFVIGFNVKAGKAARKLVEEEKVLMKTYTIIYELLDEVYEVRDLILEGQKEEILGIGKIATLFSTSDGKIAGITVTSGRLAKGDKIRIMRGEGEIGTGRILGLKQGKEAVSKVEQGQECGAKLSANLDFLASDMILSIKVSEIKL